MQSSFQTLSSSLIYEQSEEKKEMVEEGRSPIKSIEKQKESPNSEKKKSIYNMSKQMFQSAHKALKSSIDAMRVNEKEEKKNICELEKEMDKQRENSKEKDQEKEENDSNSVSEQEQQDEQDQVLESLQYHLRQLQQKKKKKQHEMQRISRERLALKERCISWTLPSFQLKYYLQQQIKLFTDQIEQLNRKERERYDQLIQKIAICLQKELDIQVKVYGSFATKLCLADSDIDVVAIPKTPLSSTLAEIELLESITHTLQYQHFITSTKFIKSATMPVIKLICSAEYNYKKIDITLQNATHNGLNCVNIIKHFLEKYQQLRPLTFVLKYYLYKSNLTNTYQGGLSSYSLILMIVSILQGYQAIRRQNQRILTSQLLIKFLWCYGFQFDYVNKAIFIESPYINIDRTNYKGFWIPLMYMDAVPRLYLIDPLDMNNNVGRATHQIKQIEKAFCKAHTVIHANYGCMEKEGECKYWKKIEKVGLPGALAKRRKARPCCILRRMFACGKF